MCVCTHSELDFSILHAEVQSGCFQIPISTWVIDQRHEPTQIQLLYILFRKHTYRATFKGTIQPQTDFCETQKDDRMPNVNDLIIILNSNKVFFYVEYSY